MKIAVITSTTAMARWIVRRGQCTTVPVPNQAPSPPVVTMVANVRRLTETAVRNSAASRIVGIAWPILSVPGIFSSSTTRPSRSTEVVVANEPTPRVSRKSVTRPRASSPPMWRRGTRVGVCALGVIMNPGKRRRSEHLIVERSNRRQLVVERCMGCHAWLRSPDVADLPSGIILAAEALGTDTVLAIVPGRHRASGAVASGQR